MCDGVENKPLEIWVRSCVLTILVDGCDESASLLLTNGGGAIKKRLDGFFTCWAEWAGGFVVCWPLVMIVLDW